MSLKKFLQTSLKNVVFKKLLSSDGFRYRPDRKIKQCPCSLHCTKETVLENATFHEKLRRKGRQVRKEIDKVVKEMEKRKEFPGVPKEE